MDAQDYLRTVLANLNKYEFWTTELTDAVRDAEAFLDRADLPKASNGTSLEHDGHGFGSYDGGGERSCEPGEKP